MTMKQLKTYEIRLREEFKNLQKLQQRKEVQGIINIEYKDRKTGEKQHISVKPSNINIYPEEFFITYTFPLYTNSSKLNKDWIGILKIKMTKDSLLNSANIPAGSCELTCQKGYPFNHHVSPGYFCVGGIWKTSIGFGLWYFILAVGALLNQEEAWLTDDGSGHLNREAYDFWKERNKAKINNIKWPFNLLDEKTKISKRNQPKITKFKIGKKPIKPKKTFTIGK